MMKIEVSNKTYKKIEELRKHMETKLGKDFSTDKMLSSIIDMIWHEQETGEVAYIT